MFVICSPLFPSLDWYQMFTLVKKDSLYCSEPILTLTMWPCVDEKRMNTVGSAASDVFVWECRRNVNSVLSYACLEKFLDRQSNGETSAAWQTWQLMSQHPFMSADNHWCLFAINVYGFCSIGLILVQRTISPIQLTAFLIRLLCKCNQYMVSAVNACTIIECAGHIRS